MNTYRVTIQDEAPKTIYAMYYCFDHGVLIFYDEDRERLVAYAKGAWKRVERA
jgi:hypothetical protein